MVGPRSWPGCFGLRPQRSAVCGPGLRPFMPSAPGAVAPGAGGPPAPRGCPGLRLSWSAAAVLAAAVLSAPAGPPRPGRGLLAVPGVLVVLVVLSTHSGAGSSPWPALAALRPGAGVPPLGRWWPAAAAPSLRVLFPPRGLGPAPGRSPGAFWWPLGGRGARGCAGLRARGTQRGGRADARPPLWVDNPKSVK